MNSTSDFETPTANKKSVIPKTVWILGLMMFLMNLSYVMVFSLCGVYLKSKVGLKTGTIGALENIAEGLSYTAKLFSGIISDFLRKRKLVMLIGYGLIIFSRPILAFAGNPMIILGSIFTERLGNGIQGTPRDAMVSDVAPDDRKGACFGLKRSLATAGSFLGAVLAMLAMFWTFNDYQTVFLIAAIPSFIAFLILVFVVKEPKGKKTLVEDKEPIKKSRSPIKFSDVPRLGGKFWMLMIVTAIFMYSRIGETFIVLHAHETFSLGEAYTPVMMMLYNGSYALLTFPLAHLSDKMNRATFLVMGIVALIAADWFLWKADSFEMLIAGAVLWGIQMGLAHSMFAALISDVVPNDLRGTGFGFFYLVSAIFSVLSGVSAGYVANTFGLSQTFAFSGIVGVVALVALLILCAFGVMRRDPELKKAMLAKK
jgi:MFS family permease